MIFSLHISNSICKLIIRPFPQSNSALQLEYSHGWQQQFIPTIALMSLEWYDTLGHVKLLSDSSWHLRRGKGEKGCLMQTITLHISKCSLQRHFLATATILYIVSPLLAKLNSREYRHVSLKGSTSSLLPLPTSNICSALLCISLCLLSKISKMQWVYLDEKAVVTWSVLTPKAPSNVKYILSFLSPVQVASFLLIGILSLSSKWGKL